MLKYILESLNDEPVIDDANLPSDESAFLLLKDSDISEDVEENKEDPKKEKDLEDDRIYDIYEDDDFDKIFEYVDWHVGFPDELHYEDLEIAVGTIPATYWDPPESIDGEVDWDYTYDTDNAAEDLFTFLDDNSDKLFGGSAVSGKKLKEVLDDPKFFSSFEDYLMDRYYDRAVDDAQDNWEPDEPDYDPYDD